MSLKINIAAAQTNPKLMNPGENLEGIGPELDGLERRVRQRSRSGSVDSDAQGDSAILINSGQAGISQFSEIVKFLPVPNLEWFYEAARIYLHPALPDLQYPARAAGAAECRLAGEPRPQ